MLVDEYQLFEFEKYLNPQNLNDSPMPASLIGYGEISAIFEIAGNTAVAFKRLPLFTDHYSAKTYIDKYDEYCRLLTEAGLSLPQHQTVIIEVPGHPVTVYIAQEKFSGERFGHRLIRVLEPHQTRRLLESIVREILKIRQFNRINQNALNLALDGQLSNWVRPEKNDGSDMCYIDTSTPLFRKDGVEQLDAELFLKSAPVFLRWILRWFFLADVINRYYDLRQVFVDLAANLYKEQCPELIHVAIDVINAQLAPDQAALTADEVKKYYRQDKLIWSLFLAFRRIDRWLTTKLLRRRYEFILPGKIQR